MPKGDGTLERLSPSDGGTSPRGATVGVGIVMNSLDILGLAMTRMAVRIRTTDMSIEAHIVLLNVGGGGGGEEWPSHPNKPGGGACAGCKKAACVEGINLHSPLRMAPCTTNPQSYTYTRYPTRRNSTPQLYTDAVPYTIADKAA